MRTLSPGDARRYTRNIPRFGALLMLLSLLGLAQVGCKSSTTDPNQSVFGGQSQPVTSTIYGRIVDESGAAMSGVQVSVGTATATTDARGFYIVKNASVPSDRVVIVAKRSGYFDAAKAVEPVKNGATRIDASMMQLTTTSTINASSGGTVNAGGTAQVVFQPGSFVDGSGNAYNGTVNVAARYLDPRNIDYFDYFPGDNVAQTTSGSTVGLISCGVVRVALLGSAGQQLQLNPAKPATISYPAPIDPKAPSSMPLWYFDETLGKWKQDGAASLTSGKYVGTVTHFTDWNLDYYDSTGTFGAYGDAYLRVVCNGIPIEGVTITIVGDDAPGKYFVHPGGKTGPDGKLHFYRFPANRDVLVDVRAAKNQGLYWINTPIKVNITPGQKFDMGDINLDSPCPAAIKGTLTDCGDTAAEGLVLATVGTTTTYLYTKSGQFMLSVPSASPFNVDAMNVNGDQATTISVPALASGEQRDLGSIKICGNGVPTYTDIPLTKVAIGSMRLSPDGSRLAIGTQQPNVVTIYDSKTVSVLSTVTLAANEYVTNLEFSVDNSKLMVFTSQTQGSSVYDISTATATKLVNVPNLITAHLYDDGSKLLGMVPGTHTINVYSTTDGSIVSTLHPTYSTPVDSVTGMVLVRDENAFLYTDVTANNSDVVWSIANDTKLRSFAVTGSPYYFFASEDGATVAHSTDYLTFHCYDTKSGNSVGDITLAANGRESGLILTKNNAYVSDHSSSALIIRITNIASGASTLRLLSDSSGYVRSITASRDESTLAAASYTGVRIWKLK